MSRSPWAVAADIWDPPEPDTFGRLGYTPNPGPQTELHAIPLFSDGGPFDVLYGGAAFGGKSYGLLMDALAKGDRYPGLETWWVRATYPELRDSVISDLEALGWARSIGARWNGSDYMLRLPNGSKLLFRHARNMADAAEMLSAACQYLIFDERTTLDPKVVEKLSTRVRSGRPGVPVVGVRSATNPGGPGHSRTKADFIDPAPLGRKRIVALDAAGDPIRLDDGRTLDRYFLPARIDDNPAGKAADPSYAARFSMMSADLAAAYRDGDWSRFEGMRFPTFDVRTHVVPAAHIDIPIGNVRKGLGIDWGGSSPFAAIWGVVLNEQLIVYRELHEVGLTPTQQAQKILASELPGERLPQRPIDTVIDPSTWSRSPDKPLAKPISPNTPVAGSIADGYWKAGLRAERAFNDRIAGWSLIDELLVPHADGRLRLVVSDACPNLIRSLTGAPRDPVNPEDVDGRYGDDHSLDGFRYLVARMMRHGTRQRAAPHRGARVPAMTAGLAKARF